MTKDAVAGFLLVCGSMRNAVVHSEQFAVRCGETRGQLPAELHAKPRRGVPGDAILPTKKKRGRFSSLRSTKLVTVLVMLTFFISHSNSRPRRV